MNALSVVRSAIAGEMCATTNARKKMDKILEHCERERSLAICGPEVALRLAEIGMIEAAELQGHHEKCGCRMCEARAALRAALEKSLNDNHY